MKAVSVSELKARLSDHHREVKAGSEILITDRGKPVARLIPMSRASTGKESLSALEKEGLVKIGSGKIPRNFWKMPRAEDREGLVLKALLEEREGETASRDKVWKVVPRPARPAGKPNCQMPGHRLPDSDC